MWTTGGAREGPRSTPHLWNECLDIGGSEVDDRCLKHAEKRNLSDDDRRGGVQV
jgi:hypothetical protein